MTQSDREYAIERIKFQLEDGYIDLGCHDEDELKIIKQAMSALSAVEQFRWERDVAIEQLNELGIGFGQKIYGIYLTRDKYNELAMYKVFYIDSLI